MPPNRKGHNDILNGIAELNVSAFVKESAFPPLTQDNVKEARTTSATSPQVEQRPSDTQSYWDWPADETIQRMEEEERVRQLFSSDRLEANLKSESTRMQQKTHVIHADHKNTDEVEAYWHMPETDVAPMKLTSAQHIEDNLKQNNPTPPGDDSSLEKAAYLEDPTHPGHSYWDWPSIDEKEQRIVQSILQEERARRLLQIDHIEKRLVEEARARNYESASPNLVAANDAYWAF